MCVCLSLCMSMCHMEQCVSVCSFVQRDFVYVDQQLENSVLLHHYTSNGPQTRKKKKKKWNHNESWTDNRRVHWQREIEGARTIQAHQERIHPCTPTGFHYEDSGFSVANRSVEHANGAAGLASAVDSYPLYSSLILITESLRQLYIPPVWDCT